MSEQHSAPSRIGHFLKREPLVHFLGLAALLFVANALLSGDAREVIAIDAATQAYLIEQRQLLMLRDLTEAEKQAAIEDFVEQEILVREARKRGLENNSRVRSLLVQNMRFFMASEVPDPTEDELRTYFDANTDQFATQPTVTYEHAHFADPDAVPANTLAALRSGTNHKTIGDTTFRNASLHRYGEKEVVASFGRETATAILAIDDADWHGPFTSPQGAHFLRVAERHPGTRPSYELAKGWVEQQWRMQKMNEVVERELGAMRQHYRIELAKPGDDAE